MTKASVPWHTISHVAVTIRDGTNQTIVNDDLSSTAREQGVL